MPYKKSSLIPDISVAKASHSKAKPPIPKHSFKYIVKGAKSWDELNIQQFNAVPIRIVQSTDSSQTAHIFTEN
jgi:ABC-type phosphate transport system substrate-binding protein